MENSNICKRLNTSHWLQLLADGTVSSMKTFIFLALLYILPFIDTSKVVLVSRKSQRESGRNDFYQSMEEFGVAFLVPLMRFNILDWRSRNFKHQIDKKGIPSPGMNLHTSGTNLLQTVTRS